MSGPEEGASGGGADRRAELVQGLGRVRARVADACAAAGRRTTEVTLVVVTKTYPADDVAALAALGVRDVGEAREQELRDKRERLDPVGGTGEPLLRWHVVGRLQRNKARSVGRLADVVHSVDDPRLVVPLARGAADAGRTLGCFAQVSLDGDPARGGAPVDDLPALCDLLAGTDGVRLLGLMAVAPLGADPASSFARLASLAAGVAASYPGADALSAGMSGDLEQALAHGATHLRVGAAVLGPRPPTH
ncbi:YggS family pyridoxal phosphate-dependent enzyme [Aquipuribacter hungaricus]|uniref:Pyridoxal phosphate homeostasis protein n=1 Tax=Aquipuribacter hungaricus TaxID=545624 RepID=A0ABV7WLP2_9MICO